MKRGDIITVALQGDYGKPRPAVVIQSDLVPPGDSVLVCPISSTPHEDETFKRHSLATTPETGLRVASQVMVDKIVAIRRDRCGALVGRLDQRTLRELTGKLAIMIGIED
jgi:mRNA interferase MazF